MPCCHLKSISDHSSTNLKYQLKWIGPKFDIFKGGGSKIFKFFKIYFSPDSTLNNPKYLLKHIWDHFDIGGPKGAGGGTNFKIFKNFVSHNFTSNDRKYPLEYVLRQFGHWGPKITDGGKKFKIFKNLFFTQFHFKRPENRLKYVSGWLGPCLRSVSDIWKLFFQWNHLCSNTIYALNYREA